MTYAKTAKQVDVRALKGRLWELLQGASGEPRGGDAGDGVGHSVEFQEVIQELHSGDGARLEDLSVHLCFICLLHLANEHSLVVSDVTQMDRLLVSNLPAPV